MRCCKEADFFGYEGDLQRLRDFISGVVATVAAWEDLWRLEGSSRHGWNLVGFGRV